MPEYDPSLTSMPGNYPSRPSKEGPVLGSGSSSGRTQQGSQYQPYKGSTFAEIYANVGKFQVAHNRRNNMRYMKVHHVEQLSIGEKVAASRRGTKGQSKTIDCRRGVKESPPSSHTTSTYSHISGPASTANTIPPYKQRHYFPPGPPSNHTITQQSHSTQQNHSTVQNTVQNLTGNYSNRVFSPSARSLTGGTNQGTNMGITSPLGSKETDRSKYVSPLGSKETDRIHPYVYSKYYSGSRSPSPSPKAGSSQIRHAQAVQSINNQIDLNLDPLLIRLDEDSDDGNGNINSNNQQMNQKLNQNEKFLSRSPPDVLDEFYSVNRAASHPTVSKSDIIGPASAGKSNKYYQNQNSSNQTQSQYSFQNTDPRILAQVVGNNITSQNYGTNTSNTEPSEYSPNVINTSSQMINTNHTNNVNQNQSQSGQNSLSKKPKGLAFLRLHDFLFRTHLGSLFKSLKEENLLEPREAEKLNRRIESGNFREGGGDRRDVYECYFRFVTGGDLDLFVEDLKLICRT